MTALALLAQPAGAGEFRLTLDGEAGVRSDGNYGQVAQSGEDVQDQDLARGGLSLGLSWNQLDRWQLALGYSPSYERSLDDSAVSGTAHRLNLALRGDLTRRTSLQAHDRFLSTPNLDLYQPVVAGEPLAAPRRGDQLLHSLDVSLNHELSRRFSFIVGADTSQRRFEDPELVDSDTWGGHLGAAWRWTAEHTLQADASAGRFSYENGRETDVRTIGLGYDRPLGRNVRLSLEAGTFWVDATPATEPVNPTDPTDPADAIPQKESKTGWRGGVRFSQQLELFHWEAGYRHDVAPGYGLGREAVVNNGFIGVSTSIGRQLVLGLDANASRQREIDEAAHRDVSERNLDLAAGTARMSWAFLPGLRLTGGYSRIWQSSKVEPFEDLSYDRYFLGLTFRIFSTGEPPRLPEELEHLPEHGETTDAETDPDAQ